MTTPSPITGKSWLLPTLLITVVLILPLLLFVFWGETFLSVAEQWQTDPPGRWALAAAVTAILASDVFLPVPSGPISTLAGSQLGIVLGTASSTIGMTLGSLLAFALAKTWGRPLALHTWSTNHLAEIETACANHGVWMLILSRPLPILAEACVLLVGALQMRWQQFLPTVLVSNFLIAATYSVLGQQAADYGWLPMAVCASIGVPVLITWWWRRQLPSSQ